MDVSKITKGKFKIYEDAEYDECEVIQYQGATFGRMVIAEVNDQLERRANAELITEAFNVANETGLSPRQLLEQRDSLLDVVKFFEKFDKVETFSEKWEELANQHNEMVLEALTLIKQT